MITLFRFKWNYRPESYVYTRGGMSLLTKYNYLTIFLVKKPDLDFEEFYEAGNPKFRMKLLFLEIIFGEFSEWMPTNKTKCGATCKVLQRHGKYHYS